MKHWYDTTEARQWLKNKITKEQLREVERVFHDPARLEAAVHLLVSHENPENYNQKFQEVKESILGAHAAALFYLFRHVSQETFEKKETGLTEGDPALFLEGRQYNLGEKKRETVVSFFEDLIYFLYQQTPLWWYTCPSVSYALKEFKESRGSSHV